MVVSLPSTFSMSTPYDFNDKEVPQILEAAWSVRTPGDKPLSEQLNTHEKKFLVMISEYIETSLGSPLSASEPETVLSDILMTINRRLSLLPKQTTLSPHFVVIVVLLQLLSKLFSADKMKYKSLSSFLEVYPAFEARSSIEKEKLFHTANWMHILFKITTAKKNKGLVMEIIPRFVEGNGVQYVTGSGQTQSTKDRVTIYETEGGVTPVKRQHRKAKKDGYDIEREKHSGRKGLKAERKATYVKQKTLPTGRGGVVGPVEVRASKRVTKPSSRLSHSCITQFGSDDEGGDFTDENLSGGSVGHSHYNNHLNNAHTYLPLPAPFSMSPPVPIRRSQSSFSQAAALIASFHQRQAEVSVEPTQSGREAEVVPCVYVKSPRESYLDVGANGNMTKSSSANWGQLSCSLSCSSLDGISIADPKSDTSGGTESGGVELNSEDQLQMLREASEDSDFSVTCESHVLPSGGGKMEMECERDDAIECEQETVCPNVTPGSLLLPPHLLHQPSLTLICPSPGLQRSFSGGGSGSGLRCSSSDLTYTIGSPVPTSSGSSGTATLQPRTLERCPSSSLDEGGEVDFELLEELTRQQGQGGGRGLASCYSWLNMGAVGGGAGSSLSDGGQKAQARTRGEGPRLGRSSSASSLAGVPVRSQ